MIGTSVKEQSDQQTRRDMIRDIIRMSQKALAYVLAMVAVGFVGGMIAIIAEPELANALAGYAAVFVPVFQLEIGVYGLGSTMENVQKIKAQVDKMSESSKSKDENG